MRHTVIGLFETYAQAESARDTLVQTGFARDTIELQANPLPSATAASDAVEGAGVLANIERFIGSLFSKEPRAPQAQRYTDAVRRGAVLVCVNAASEAHAELASTTLTRLGATDVGERLPGWDTAPTDQELGREHSMLDELGIGAAAPRMDSRVDPRIDPLDPRVDPLEPVARDTPVVDPVRSAAAERSLDERVDPRVEEALRTQQLSEAATLNSIAAGSAPGFGAVFMPVDTAASARRPDATIGETIPDEFLEYEEDFRNHYDELYASGGDGHYEDYVPAYRYGATIGRDAQYRDRPWDDVEPEARRHWETTSPGSADTWERFKAAVRHGWDRVTGHHHV
ncbi:hypothetical protein [Paraburkholderia sp. DHOC27]|uniref:hypothetical protein n=1 Tax=Paraburkholderia sp. DHOC27 TaxID=2303330 RepID=UPI000E3B6388|nr:hypothetical protein [Paraburkholderia sp. DHOC27]RFU48666.1 hypothetical protein D0B32_02175 [Paraburkholderia sp. DHOC27]